MVEIFNSDDNKNDNFFLHINLPKIENQYENYTELFWLKQLPFNINIQIMKGNEKRYDLILNSFMEYRDAKNLLLYCKFDLYGIGICYLSENNEHKYFMLFNQFIGKFIRK